MKFNKSKFSALLIAVVYLIISPNAYADWCEGVSHIACYPGIDNSGRSPQALYEAAEEGLREATTPDQRAMAEQAMKDAFNPAMQNQQAVLCYSQGKMFTLSGQCINEAAPVAQQPISQSELSNPQQNISVPTGNSILGNIAAMLGVSFSLFALIICFLYFVPSIVSIMRGGSTTVIVVLLNICLGWTVLGWFAALSIALFSQSKNQIKLQKMQLEQAQRLNSTQR